MFLSAGRCPILDGQPGRDFWSHPGSYMGEMSFQHVVDGRVHAVLVTSGAASNGFTSVQMDGEAVLVGTNATFEQFSVHVRSSHSVSIHTEEFDFVLSNSDHFINQVVSAVVPLSALRSHGVLGQTHSARTYSNALRYVEGDVDDYAIADNDLFGDDFVFNQFLSAQSER